MTAYEKTQVQEAIEVYCYHRDVEPSDVVVTYECDEGGGNVVRFRLSLDVDGKSHGCDEWINIASEKLNVRVDHECNAEEFWAALRERHPELAKDLERQNTVTVPRSTWEEIQTLPGFADGPAYARTALIEVSDVE